MELRRRYWTPFRLTSRATVVTGTTAATPATTAITVDLVSDAELAGGRLVVVFAELRSRPRIDDTDALNP